MRCDSATLILHKLQMFMTHHQCLHWMACHSSLLLHLSPAGSVMTFSPFFCVACSMKTNAWCCHKSFGQKLTFSMFAEQVRTRHAQHPFVLSNPVLCSEELNLAQKTNQCIEKLAVHGKLRSKEPLGKVCVCCVNFRVQALLSVSRHLPQTTTDTRLTNNAEHHNHLGLQPVRTPFLSSAPETSNDANANHKN